MAKRRWPRFAAIALASSLLAAACGDDDNDTADETTTTAAGTETTAPAAGGDGVLKIGYLLPETGQLAFLGPPMIDGVKMAVEEINAVGGINGRPVELYGQDDGTDPDVAGGAADKLLAEGVDVIVGAAASGVSLAVIDKITGSQTVMCSPSNTGLQFTTYDDGGYYFRTAPPDNLQAQVLADLIVADGAEKVVVIGRSDEYGEGFANALADELEALGVEVADVVIFDHTATSFQAEAQRIKDANPDSVAMISFDEGGQVVQAAIAAGVGPDAVQWYGADGIQTSSFYEKVDPNNPAVVEGIRGTAPSAAPADGEATFRERFEAFSPGTDTIYSGHAYDCAVIAALAAAEAGSDAATDIQAHMVGVTRDGERCTLVADCLELIADGADIDYDGAAGPLDFVEAGEPGAGAYDSWEFAADGSVAVIEESISVGGEG